MLTIVQLGTYNYFNYTKAAAATLIIGLILLYVINVLLLILYIAIVGR